MINLLSSSIFFDENDFKKDSEKIENIISKLPKPMVFTNGVFDILHTGHIRYLNESRKLGGSLVVGINSNESVKMLHKGSDRPILTQEDRAEIVSSLKPVDLCIIFNQKTPEYLIKKIKPQVYTKGDDYSKETITYFSVLKELKIKTIFIPLIKKKSSTIIVNKIKNL